MAGSDLKKSLISALTTTKTMVKP